MIIRIARPLRFSLSSSDSTPARTETSSIETGSSATRSVGLEDQRGRDRDALALSAGQLVRIAVEIELRRRQLDALERVADACLPLGSRAADAVDRERLLDRLPHAEARVERLVRVLVDHLDPPPQRPERTHAEVRQVAALEADRARRPDRSTA